MRRQEIKWREKTTQPNGREHHFSAKNQWKLKCMKNDERNKIGFGSV